MRNDQSTWTREEIILLHKNSEASDDVLAGLFTTRTVVAIKSKLNRIIKNGIDKELAYIDKLQQGKLSETDIAVLQAKCLKAKRVMQKLEKQYYGKNEIYTEDL